MLSLNDKYKVYRCDRPGGRSGGGVCILVRANLQSVAVPINTALAGFDIVAVDIFASVSFRIICAYRPPNLPLQSCEQLIECIASLSDIEQCCVVTGDFNVPRVNWQNMTCPAGDSAGNALLTFSIDHSLLQFVHAPTRCENILDLIFCRDEMFILGTEISVPFANSDHYSVNFTLDCSPLFTNFVPKPNFRKGDYVLANQMLSNIDWVHAFWSCSDVEQCYLVFNSILLEVIHVCVPTQLSRPHVKNYPMYVRKAQVEKKRLWRLRHLSRGQLAYARSAHKCSNAIRRFERTIEREIVSSGDCRNLYRYVQKQTKPRPFVAPLRDENNVICTSDDVKARLLQNQFSSVFTVDNDIMPVFECRTDALLDLVSFTHENISATLSELKEKTSNTPDGLPAYFLKRVRHYIVLPLLHIFSQSFLSGIVPKIWRSAIVVPIYKKGPADQAINYRPISLTSVVCRVMEKIICNAMSSFLHSNNLISPDQHGFLSRRSTVTQLLEATFDWYSSINAGNCVDVIYIDYQKAFDSCSHPKLLKKLLSYGINGRLHTWISSFLADRSQCVQIGSSYSRVSPAVSGVPQGSVIGPLLFLLFINDLSDSLGNVSVKLYADDAKIYSSFSLIDDTFDLDRALIALHNWSSIWQLPIAVSKCNVLHIGHSNPKLFYALGANILEPVSVMRDLGVLVSSGLTPSAQCTSAAIKASCVANMLLRCFKGRHALTMIRAFKCFVLPIVEYATTVWSPFLVRDIALVENVQKQFTRRVLKKCNIDPMSYEERLLLYGMDTLELRRLKTDLILMYKMHHGIVDLNVSRFFPPPPARNVNLRSNSANLQFPYVPRLNSVKYSFAFRVRKFWNQLPSHCITAPNVYTFRKLINIFLAQNPPPQP